MRDETVRKFVPFVIFAFSVAATLMIFLPALHYEDLTVTGIEIAFGTELEGAPGFDTEELEINYYAMTAYFAPVIGGLVTLVLRSGNLFSLAMLVLAAVLFFLLPNYVEVIRIDGEERVVEAFEWTHGIGLILAGIFSVIAALAEMLHISMEDRMEKEV